MTWMARMICAVVTMALLEATTAAAQEPTVVWRHAPSGSHGPELVAMSASGRYAVVSVPTADVSPVAPVDVLLLEDGHVVREMGADLRPRVASIAVSDQGDLVIATYVDPFNRRGLPRLRQFQANHIVAFDRSGGRLLAMELPGLEWSAARVGISPDGAYVVIGAADQVWLYSRQGQRVWQRTVPGASDVSVRSIRITNGASIIIIDDGLSKAYWLDRNGNLVASLETAFPGTRLSPSGRFLGVARQIPNAPEGKAAVAVYQTSTGEAHHWAGLPTGAFDETIRWELLDFAVSDSGVVAIVLDMSAHTIGGSGVGVRLFTSDGRQVGSREGAAFYYALSAPSGGTRPGKPVVALSSSGELMLVSTGVEIRSLRNLALGKVW